MMLKRYGWKKTLSSAGLGLLLLTFVWIAGCDFGIPDYTLFVTLEEGVQGTPVQGEHVYEDLSTISYDYESIVPGGTIEVFLNESQLSGTGSFTMYNSARLSARVLDIRGVWNVKMRWLASAEVNFEFEITFDGPDPLGGTFTDNRGFQGTWTGLNNALYVTYTTWSDFALSGSIFGMTGSFGGDGESGTFEMTRVTPSF
jgi:hypothetical protein